MPKENDKQQNGSDKDADMASRLAKVIANNDTEDLKKMLMARLGVNNQEELLAKALSALNEEDFEAEDDEPRSKADMTPSPQHNPQKGRGTSLDASLTELLNDKPPNLSSNSSSTRDALGLLGDNADILSTLFSLVGQGSTHDPRVHFLNALKPFLNGQRQQKIEPAIKLMGVTTLLENQLNNMTREG